MEKIKLGLLLAFLAIIGCVEAQTSSVTALKMSQISLLVTDYDAALLFYTETLGFEKKKDMAFGGQRWVTIVPPGQKGTTLVLVKATEQADFDAVGKQAGNRTFMVLETDDFDTEYIKYKEKGVRFINEPTVMPWGRQVRFVDLYGNNLVLLDTKIVPKVKE